jgi:citrate lyase gamma subunit
MSRTEFRSIIINMYSKVNEQYKNKIAEVILNELNKL